MHPVASSIRRSLTAAFRGRAVACLVAMAVTGAMAVLAGCGSKVVEPPPVPDPLPVPVGYRPLSTPASAILNLRQLYQNRDDDAIAMLDTLMRKDTFIRDYADSTQYGSQVEHRLWGRERANFANRFVHDPTLTKADLTWLTAPADTSDPTPCALIGDPPSTFRFKDRPYTLVLSHGYADSVVSGIWDVYVAPVSPTQQPLRWQIVRWGDIVQSVQPRYRPLTTPAAPLIDLGLCWQHCDEAAAAEYATLFDDAHFTFTYTDDTGPHAWGAGVEIAASQAVFRDPGAVTKLRYLLQRADTLAMTPSTVAGDPSGTLRCHIRAVNFTFRNQPGIQYGCAGSADIYVAPLGGVWKIVRWEDGTAPAPIEGGPTGDVTGITWAGIKASYIR